MISLGDITSFDVIVVVLFLLFIVRGTWIGFMRQLSFFLALVFSYMIAGQYTGQMMPYVGKFIENPKSVFFISFALLFIIGAIIFILLGKVLHLVMQLSLAGWFDRLLGLILGLVKAALVTSFLYMTMSSGPSSAHDLVKKSITSEYLTGGAAFVQQLLNDPELKQKFVPKAPAIPPEKKSAPDSSEDSRQTDEHLEKSFIDSHFFNDSRE
ncbi:MAG: CvpA family protein [Desulfobulbaceae bacterium]|nr:CvpA family protein [Desulfobulbaceae bacterium]